MQPYNNNKATQQRWYDGNGGVGTLQSRPGQTEISYQNGEYQPAGYVNSQNPYGVQSNTGNHQYGRQIARVQASYGQTARTPVNSMNTQSAVQEASPLSAVAGGFENETYYQPPDVEQPSSTNLLALYRRAHLDSPGGRIRSISLTSQVFGSTWW